VDTRNFFLVAYIIAAFLSILYGIPFLIAIATNTLPLVLSVLDYFALQFGLIIVFALCFLGVLLS